MEGLSYLHQKSLDTLYPIGYNYFEISLEAKPRELMIFEAEPGVYPLEDWINSLKDIQGRAIVRKRLNRVRLGNLGDAKSVRRSIMAKKVKKYEDSLQESLRVPDEAAAYLNAHLNDNESDGEELFLMALRDVAKAYGVSEIAKTTKLGRESLYKTLSLRGNPKVETLRTLLKAMGLKLAVEVAKKKRTA